MAETPSAQYGGGIIVNPGFDHNIEGWTVFGKGAIEERVSNGGNIFIVALNRTQPLDSFSQKVQLKKGMLYSFSGNFCFSSVNFQDNILIHTLLFYIYEEKKKKKNDYKWFFHWTYYFP